MEKIVRQTLLYDFYGELLNERQRQVYGDIISGDLSYSEFAAEQDISRQAVFDMVRRCDEKLEGYEAKLGLVKRFMEARDSALKLSEMIDKLSGQNLDKSLDPLIEDIRKNSDKIFDSFDL